ncbi:type II secretion system protein GspD [Beggiatoa leptomitoformis]|uniref:Type II/III secretion system secretin-like domain-containing protein n=1 Tax=Beggiatoa leptomitoformis TaxID=288004 RepID=A0A2N9YCV4_9GAMM|nr:hypothetical protein [Beggiatoa leptomitoformis]AUI68291.1 hypothetical protein BLE401_05975 [Beggiatoa leptomitoformis]QGX03425.1 hypothetical protein AL038_18181 [Beggiatoa leptomitoformis]
MYRFLMIYLLSFSVFAVETGKAPAGLSISFERIDIPTLLDMVYTDILQQSYLVHSDVLARKDLITVRLRAGFPIAQLDGFMRNLLLSYGITVEKKKEYLYFKPLQPTSQTIPLETFFYVPRYRSADYLLNLLKPVLQNYLTVPQDTIADSTGSHAEGIAAGSQVGVNPLAKTAYSTENNDSLILIVPQDKVSELKVLIEQLDVPAKQVHVRAYVYEVTNNKNENSNALQVAMNLLSSKLQINIGALRSSGQTAVLNTGDFDLIFNVFSTDTRFKTVSSPSLFVRSGESAQFVVGTETPVLTGVSNTDKYQAQQVDYRTSGVVFKIKPVILEDTIDLDIHQQVSSFVNTTTGVADSPTLLKREIATRLNIQNRQLIVISGLRENKLQDDNTYFPFTSWSMGSEQSEQTSDIIMFLYCELMDEVNQGQRFALSHNLDDFIISLPDK